MASLPMFRCLRFNTVKISRRRSFRVIYQISVYHGHHLNCVAGLTHRYSRSLSVSFGLVRSSQSPTKLSQDTKSVPVAKYSGGSCIQAYRRSGMSADCVIRIDDFSLNKTVREYIMPVILGHSPTGTEHHLMYAVGRGGTERCG